MISREQLKTAAFWASELSDDEQERVRKGLTLRSYEAGAYLMHRGDVVDSWTGIAQGLMKLGSITDSGKPVTFAGLPAGMWFGEGSLIKGEPRQYDVVALRNTQVAFLNRATFLWLFENSLGFNKLLVRLINERLGQFIGLVEQHRMLESAGQMARSIAWLFNPVLCPSIGDHIEISQEEMGLLAGVSRQVTNRVLRELEADGLIALERGGITVKDLKRLRRYGE